MISTKGFGNCIEDKKIILYIKNVPITSIEIFISFGKKKKFFNVRFSRNISLGDKPSIFKGLQQTQCKRNFSHFTFRCFEVKTHATQAKISKNIPP